MKKLFSLFLAVFSGCTGIPDGVQPVDDFDLQRYLGTWYEIARLDHSFERGLTNVSATYGLNSDGSVRVTNKGYDPRTGGWKIAEGRAKFISVPTIGRLKVSFFGPFYGAYNIIELDKEGYSYALVCGPDRSYLWILARKPELDRELLTKLVERASESGFAADQLIFVEHRNVREEDALPGSGKASSDHI